MCVGRAHVCVTVYFYSKCDFVLSPRQSLLSSLHLGVEIFFFLFKQRLLESHLFVKLAIDFLFFYQKENNEGTRQCSISKLYFLDSGLHSSAQHLNTL